MKTGVLLVLASLVAAPVLAQRPAPGSWAEQVRRLRGAHMPNRKPALPRVSRSAASVAALAATILNEHEPNGTALTADSGSLGDQASGFIDPDGDVDFWFLDLTAGQFLSVDVLAMEAGSPLDPEIFLIAPDGNTLLRFNDDFDGFDSRISFRIVTSDRYYVAIRGFAGSTGRYSIDFGTVVCGVAGNEREPNDAPGTASPAAIGDTASGEVCAHNDDPLGDVDYWAFTAQAGTAIELDVDAEELGIFSDPFLALYASDGVTQLAFNDDEDGRDSRLQFSITTTGTYFAAVSTIADPGGNPFPYRLNVRLTAQGPGDPITVRAGGLGFPLGLAVGSTGDLFVGDVTGSRVLRISTAGIVSTFASGIAVPEGLAFDAFGNLLVVSIDGNVYRITPAGQVAPFITDAGAPFWVAVGPDGRIWLTTLLDQSLRRYSAQGQFEARVDLRSIGGFGPGPLAIGLSGEPYVSNGAEIWKLVNGEPQRVLTEGSVIWAFAFDVTGNIYAPIPASGRIKLFDPTGALLADPYAIGPDGPQAVAFGRDATGATVARLFASEPQLGQLIEVNPAGVAHPGLPAGFVPFPFSLDVAAASLLGAGGLSAAEEQLLDALGNRNGRYDVGDFAAFIKTTADLGAQQRAGRNR
ncbi:MAG TPA: pre-peptidase C-terminal domain-containing protein [Gemmatimonadales bacterium]|nr:pre-peptidase C-terminal domain-containing protein [Gemmatimonadales bacterium]